MVNLYRDPSGKTLFAGHMMASSEETGVGNRIFRANDNELETLRKRVRDLERLVVQSARQAEQESQHERDFYVQSVVLSYAQHRRERALDLTDGNHTREEPLNEDRTEPVPPVQIVISTTETENERGVVTEMPMEQRGVILSVNGTVNSDSPHQNDAQISMQEE